MRLLELRLTREIVVKKPAVGTNWLVTVPGGVIWSILCINQQLFTSAIAGTRTPLIVVRDPDARPVAFHAGAGTAAASQAPVYGYQAGLGTNQAVNTFVSALPSPPMPLFSGWTIGEETSGLDAGDQWDRITLVVSQWSETDVVQESMVIDAQLSSLTEREVTGR
jgi:hypothetical protein